MPNFGNDEHVEVLVDGEIGYRGTYGDVNRNLNTIVSKIMEKRLANKIDETRKYGDARTAEMLKQSGPGRPDTVCIAAEGKGRSVESRLKTR